jgi:hypothetical protein
MEKDKENEKMLVICPSNEEFRTPLMEINPFFEACCEISSLAPLALI